MLDDETEYDDLRPSAARAVPPFHFQFSVYCPWAESVQVLIVLRSGDHSGDPSRATHRILDLRRAEDSVWSGDIDLPGRDHTFSYKAAGNGKSVVAPFQGNLSAPGLFARMSARATYPGRRNPGRLD